MNGPAADRFGRPLRDLRLSVIDRCNFRCPYCMPEERYPEGYEFFKRSQLLSNDETVRLVGLFARLGVTKLRLTGGEPLLRKDLPALLARLRGVEGIDDIAMSTNGVLLPRLAPALHDAGLDRITISLDSTDPETFLRMSGGRGSLDEVFAGIDAARDAGFRTIKINAVLQRGLNDESLIALAERFRHSGCTLRFIEFMDVGTRNGWDRAQVVTTAEVREKIASRWPLEAVGRDYRGEVAERYRYADGGGEIGFISSISQPFCSDCTRARLSADGKLYTCLFATDGRDLKTPLRAGADDETLLGIIGRIWGARDDRYSELRARASEDDQKIEMYKIGG